MDPKYYDDMLNQPDYKPGCKTFLDFFEATIAERPNDAYLGYRPLIGPKEHGPYKWLTYLEI